MPYGRAVQAVAHAEAEVALADARRLLHEAQHDQQAAVGAAAEREAQLRGELEAVRAERADAHAQQVRARVRMWQRVRAVCACVCVCVCVRVCVCVCF